MKGRLYYPLIVVILAVFIGLFGWFSESSSVRWIAPAFGLALISVGLSIYSFIISMNTERRMADINASLSRIEGIQEEMRKEQTEQKSSGPPIVASIEAISKYYMDYINKQKEERDK